MKAAEKAPSPNILRKKFGMRKATKNASAKYELPISCAKMMSRIKPVSLEIVVIDPNAAVDFNKPAVPLAF